MSGKEKRLLDNWLDSFVELTKHKASPLIFRKWAAVSCLAGALERRVWIQTSRGMLYPNLYILLVAPPGIGKSEIVNEVVSLWSSTGLLHICPSSVSKAALIDAMAEAKRTFNEKDKEVQFHALQIANSELGVLLPVNDRSMMATFCDFYDCRESFTEKLRMRKEDVKIAKPCLNMLAATQPGYLGDFFDDKAFQQGFPARLIFVYSADTIDEDMWIENPYDFLLFDKLKRDLEAICHLKGSVPFADSGKQAFNFWDSAVRKSTDVTERRFLNYNTRRRAHLLKLAMVMGLARKDFTEVLAEDVERAWEFLQESEQGLTQITKGLEQTEHGNILADAFNHMIIQFNKTGKPVREQLLTLYLARKLPSYQVSSTIQQMINSNMIAVAGTGKSESKFGNMPGLRTFIPVDSAYHGSSTLNIMDV